MYLPTLIITVFLNLGKPQLSIIERRQQFILTLQVLAAAMMQRFLTDL